MTLLRTPAIDLEKTGALDTTVVDPDNRADVDDEIKYTFRVENTGNVTLTNVTVTDPLFTVDGGPITLIPGQVDTTTFKGTYLLNQDDIDAGKRDNTATTTGTTPAGTNPASVTDEDEYFPLPPRLRSFVATLQALVEGGFAARDVGASGPIDEDRDWGATEALELIEV
ncbi:MAG: DUF11 domain-containing protein [Acidobacteria bacterium]|nr:DUF11 domain-containing protein [Acidobacteriota bacterium]